MLTATNETATLGRDAFERLLRLAIGNLEKTGDPRLDDAYRLMDRLKQTVTLTDDCKWLDEA